MAQAHFEIFLDTDKKHRFRLRSPNGEIIATGEAYESKQACRDTIGVIRKYVAYALIQDLTAKAT